VCVTYQSKKALGNGSSIQAKYLPLVTNSLSYLQQLQLGLVRAIAPSVAMALAEA